jgi:hypothetical protein
MALTKVSTPGIKDEAITLAKLLHGDGNSDGKFLRANNGADPTFETITIPASINNLVEDTTPQLGGNLDTNNHDVTFQGLNNLDVVWDYSEADLTFSDSAKLRIGSGNDLSIYHNSGNTFLQNATGYMFLQSDSISLAGESVGQNYIVANLNGAVTLGYAGNTKIETYTDGAKITGVLRGTTTGFGIDFAETSNNSGMTSEVLDDYEEGTFTATCANGVTLHSSQDLCMYTKIGRQVTVRGQIRVNDENGGSQNLIVNNLPFINISGTDGSASTVGAVRIWDQNIPSNAIDVVCEISGNSYDLNFWINRDDASGERMKGNQNAYALFTITYFSN